MRCTAWTLVIQFRNSWLIQMGATMVRILALPLLVLSLTGWIPDKDFGAVPPVPWGPFVGLSFVVVGLLGLLYPRRPSREPHLGRGGLGATGTRPAERS
jgi:hypothetical protein